VDGTRCLDGIRMQDRPVLDTANVAVELALSMERKEPASLGALCETEAGLLWAGRGYQTWYWRSWMGIPGEAVPGAAQLAEAIPRLSFVGVAHSGPFARHPQMAPKTWSALRLWGIELHPEAQIVDRLVVFYLMFDLWLWGLLENRRVLIVNNHAAEVARAMETGDIPADLKPYAPECHGWKPAATMAVVLENGMAGSEKALGDIAKADWHPDIAFIGGGARGTYLTVEIAEREKVPALDMGSVLDRFVSPWDMTGVQWAKVHGWYLEQG